MRMGDWEVRPVGGSVGCLGMLLFSALLFVREPLGRALGVGLAVAGEAAHAAGRRLGGPLAFAATALLAAAAVADLYGRHGKPSRAEAEGTGIVFATGYGPVTSVLQFHQGVLERGISGANPALFANTVVNAAAGHVAMLHRYRGYTATIANGGTSSVLALQLAVAVAAGGRAPRPGCQAERPAPQRAPWCRTSGRPSWRMTASGMS